jgi:DmsE family decaheme c-type cytochrome
MVSDQGSRSLITDAPAAPTGAAGAHEAEMRTRIYLPGGILLLVAVLLLIGLVPGLTLAAGPKADPLADSVCASCHGDQVKAFLNNPHDRVLAAKGWRVDAICEACHGEGKKHVEAEGDKSLIKGMRGLSGAETCLKCHNAIGDHACSNCSPVGARASQGALIDTASHLTGSHAPQPAVNCLDCHSIHSAAFTAEKLLVKPQIELCESCHPTTVAAFRNKPYTHRVGRGGIECTSCHEPHGRQGKDGLKLTRAGELPCVSCHAEKKGPFVFPHVGDIAGDCMTCHQPHASNNMHMLVQPNAVQLCLNCHSRIGTNTLGSQAPAFHNIGLARYQNCTTCHTAIHGSNRSPFFLK